MYFELKSMVTTTNTIINEIEDTLFYDKQFRVPVQRFNNIPAGEQEVEQLIDWNYHKRDDVEYTITKQGNTYRMYEEVFE